jgi:hypothetical protein
MASVLAAAAPTVAPTATADAVRADAVREFVFVDDVPLHPPPVHWRSHMLLCATAEHDAHQRPSVAPCTIPASTMLTNRVIRDCSRYIDVDTHPDDVLPNGMIAGDFAIALVNEWRRRRQVVQERHRS